MLEKPDIQDEKIIDCLTGKFGLSIAEIDFLPIGADSNTAAYRAVSRDGMEYFVKLRKGDFDETAVTLPKFLSGQGISNIISPLNNKANSAWTNVENYKLILYPFIEGRNGFDIALDDHHWFEFGAALKKIHTADIPARIRDQIRRETYSAQCRESLKTSLQRIYHEAFTDSIAIETAAFLKTKRDEITAMIRRTGHLALAVQTESPEFTVCHSDLHAGNILIDNQNKLYIVDWDNPILAPKERDLMFPGGAQGFGGHSSQEEEILFYQGYGQIQINQTAHAYYRYERIIEDIAIYSEELLFTGAGGEDRKQSLQYLISNFLPGGTIEAAVKSDKNP